MIVLVTGGRDYIHWGRVQRVLTGLNAQDPITLLGEGGCPTGADAFAREWANTNGVRLATFAADWTDLDAPGAIIKHRRDGTPYNAAAGPLRNQRMLQALVPDLAVVFPGGRGTKGMLNLLEREKNRRFLEIVLVP